MRERQPSEVARMKEQESENLGLVWIISAQEDLNLLMGEALETKARLHIGEEPPQGETPSSIILSPKSESIVQEIRYLKSLAPEASILIFSPSDNDLRLAEEALRAGASGFIYAGMQPERIALALSSASKDEVLIPRELLGQLLGRRLFLRLPKFLDP